MPWKFTKVLWLTTKNILKERVGEEKDRDRKDDEESARKKKEEREMKSKNCIIIVEVM